MKTNKDILIPFYSGNIRLTKVIGLVSLHNFIQSHKNPTVGNIKLFEQIKNCNDKQVKRKLKHKLYSFTPSVLIKKGDKRKYDNIVEYTGLMQLDFDGIEDIKSAVDLKYWLYLQPEVLVTYLSPSGGVKALIRITKPRDKDHYKAIHKAVTNKYEETGYFDEATKNPMLPLFLSMDKDIKYKQYSHTTVFIDEDWSKIEYVALNNEPPPNFDNSDENLKKTISILRNKFENINNNGHPQVRNAALILGSRAGAGYIDVIQARTEIEHCIRSNNYLAKGVSGYISTALWGISEGFKNPKYY